MITFRFERLKRLYANVEDFRQLDAISQKHPKGDLLLQEEFLPKGTRLCVLS